MTAALPQRFRLHARQVRGQRLSADGKVKGFPQTRQVRVTVSDWRYFTRQAWQQSGQCWTFSGSVKVLPQLLQVRVICPCASADALRESSFLSL